MPKVSSAQEVREFADAVGLPIIIKPVSGAGASGATETPEGGGWGWGHHHHFHGIGYGFVNPGYVDVTPTCYYVKRFNRFGELRLVVARSARVEADHPLVLHDGLPAVALAHLEDLAEHVVVTNNQTAPAFLTSYVFNIPDAAGAVKEHGADVGPVVRQAAAREQVTEAGHPLLHLGMFAKREVDVGIVALDGAEKAHEPGRVEIVHRQVARQAPGHPRRLRNRLTWLLLRSGRLDRDDASHPTTDGPDRPVPRS